MKKYMISITAGLVLGATLTGCASLYDKFGLSPEEVHAAAVQKLSDYAESAVNKKIDKSTNLSDEGKAKLKAEVAKLKAEIIEKIAEIKAKTDLAKAESEK